MISMSLIVRAILAIVGGWLIWLQLGPLTMMINTHSINILSVVLLVVGILLLLYAIKPNFLRTKRWWQFWKWLKERAPHSHRVTVSFGHLPIAAEGWIWSAADWGHAPGICLDSGASLLIGYAAFYCVIEICEIDSIDLGGRIVPTINLRFLCQWMHYL